jgi:hypothetical protein
MIARILDIQLGLFAAVFSDEVVKHNIEPCICVRKSEKHLQGDKRGDMHEVGMKGEGGNKEEEKKERTWREEEGRKQVKKE